MNCGSLVYYVNTTSSFKLEVENKQFCHSYILNTGNILHWGKEDPPNIVLGSD